MNNPKTPVTQGTLQRHR